MVFERIYRENRWHGVESRSGPGSGPQATAYLGPAIVELVRDLGVTSVLDVACGDGFWMPDLPGYVGVDVAPEAIALARIRHPDRSYTAGDVRALDLPSFDLVIVRDVIQHLSLWDGMTVLSAIRDTGSLWLLASTHRGGRNVDIPTGDSYSPDLEAPPFALGDPSRVIFDGYAYDDPDAIRDPGKHLGLWPL